jgi:hypothetical protein
MRLYHQYFYTKTRNYRIFFAALRTGARYAMALSGATAAYVFMDESIGYIREQVVGYRTESDNPSGSVVTWKTPTTGPEGGEDQLERRAWIRYAEEVWMERRRSEFVGWGVGGSYDGSGNGRDL